MTPLSLTSILLLAASFTGLHAHPSSEFHIIEPAGHPITNAAPYGCGVKPPPETLLTTLKEIAVSEKAEKLNNLIERQSKTITVETYFHVVKSSAAGAIPKATLDKQLAVLNGAYSKSGITFKLAGTTFTVNKDWAKNVNPGAMKRATRKGNFGTLNLWFIETLPGLIGYCNYPADAPPSSSYYKEDGCVIDYQTLPGGEAWGTNLGHTATHEVGHWFGLIHVFGENKSCDDEGDLVDDTPVQSESANGCPTKQDSCPNKPGVDSVHNYMDYSTDDCVTNFTPGQATRMQNLYAQFRAGK